MTDTKLTTKELAELALLAAVTFAGKLAMSFLPNIHPVALMIIAVTVVYRIKAMYFTLVYVALEILCYGFGMWSISYLYIWPLLCLAALLLGKGGSRLVCAAIAGIHGLTFGAFCSIPYAVTGGIAAGISYWVAGIPYDLIHGVSNAVIVFFLIRPISGILQKLHIRTKE